MTSVPKGLSFWNFVPLYFDSSRSLFQVTDARFLNALLYQFPVASVTNRHQHSDLQQRRFIILHLSHSRSLDWVLLASKRGVDGASFPSGSFRGESISLALSSLWRLPAFLGQTRGPFLHFKGSSVWPGPFILPFTRLSPFCLPLSLRRTIVITLELPQ